MKDKNGNTLPPEMFEVKAADPYSGESAKCHGCKHPLKGSHYSYRVFDHPGTFEGERIQGPLCPNCSELPPEHLPSRKYMEDWW